jgi:hypothetical protein
VAVNQQGGLDGDVLVLFEGDSLLKRGQTYLFATRVFRERGWHTLVPQYGDLLITDDRQQQVLIDQFTKAYKEQILYIPR